MIQFIREFLFRLIENFHDFKIIGMRKEEYFRLLLSMEDIDEKEEC